MVSWDMKYILRKLMITEHILHSLDKAPLNKKQKYCTTLQSKMNAKLSKQRFWHCHENALIKTIQLIPHNLYVSVKLTSLYCGLRLTRIMIYKGMFYKSKYSIWAKK